MYMGKFAIFFIFARKSEGFEEFGFKIDKKGKEKSIIGNRLCESTRLIA